MRARMPHDIPELLVRYEAAIEHAPETHAGSWLNDYGKGATRLVVDLGCGKGQFLSALAPQHPDCFFVGIDQEDLCIAYAAQKAIEQGIPNVRYIISDANKLPEQFGEEEISRLRINFPTPFPRAKHAPKRLTYFDRLLVYRKLLTRNGDIILRTDSQPFFDFSLTQFEQAGFDIAELTRDLHATDPGLLSTEYEDRLSEAGARIHALRATMAREPAAEQTAKRSLMDYLPDDLEHIEYVPYGMESAVVNFRNRRRKEARRAARAGKEDVNRNNPSANV